MAIAKQRLAYVGVFLTNTLVVLATSLGMVFTIALDVAISGELGRRYFEPIPGDVSDNPFGWKTVLAATLLATLVIHITKVKGRGSSAIGLIDKWAPRLGVLYIVGASALLVALLMGTVVAPPVVDDWGDSTPAMAQSWLMAFSESLVSPLAQFLFSSGMGFVLFGSVFALASLFEWWLRAVEGILDKIAYAGVRADAAQQIKRVRKEYRLKAAEHNALVDRSEEQLQLAFALMVYQSAAKVIAELRKQVNRKPDKQFPDYQSPVGEIEIAEIDALAEAWSFEKILAAVQNEHS